MAKQTDDTLADGRRFKFWEKPTKFTRTYYVDCNHPRATDSGPGSKDKPFATISAAARVLAPGERVVIASGTYRERVCPARGGTGPGKMISYEAAPGAKVVVKGSIELDGPWTESTHWNWRPDRQAVTGEPRVWEMKLTAGMFPDGYNPFALANVLQDRFWLDCKRINMDPFFRRRGMVFVDGQPLTQVERFAQLGAKAGAFWVEHNGLRLHVRLPGDAAPQGKCIEITNREQVFAPDEKFLGYIRVKGLTLMHAGNGFPVPQRGLVSTYRGHHWVIEDCTIDWANAVGIDIGREDWGARQPAVPGHHVVRRNTIRNCGICGLAGFDTDDVLVEDNLIEHVGWQDAEFQYESAGMKFHLARNMLVRRNVVRHINHACGIWMDCVDVNCRITGNVFADIASISGGIHFEGNHDANLVDHNIILGSQAVLNPEGEQWGGYGIYSQGTDRLTVRNNMVVGAQHAGMRCDIIAKRIIDGRGGTARNCRVLDNVFVKCGRAALEFENAHHQIDGNVYSQMTGGFLRLTNEPHPQHLDLATWREFHGFDKRGATADITVDYDVDVLTMTVTVADDKTKRTAKQQTATETRRTQRTAKKIAVPPALSRWLGKRSIDARRSL